MNALLVILAITAIGSTLLVGILIGMILHYMLYCDGRSAGLKRILRKNKDAMEAIDAIVSYAVGAHEYIADQVDREGWRRGRG